MKVTCKKDDLLEVFSVVNAIVPTRSTIAVLQNVKLQTDENTLYVIGTDLEVGIKCEVKAEVKEKGSLLIPTARLGAILRETSDASVRIEAQNNNAHIITKDGDYKIVSADPIDYPDFPEFDAKKTVEIDPKGLKEMIHKTIFAISAEITRYALTGLLVELKKKEIRMVGSDGKRLAFVKKQTELDIPQERKIIVPARGMMLLERVLKDSQQLKIQADESQIKFNLTPGKEKHPEIIIFSRLVEGSFPDYETVIPADCDKKVELKVEELHAALRRVTVVTTDKFKVTKFIFKDNKLTLLSRTQDVGEAKVELDIKYTHTPLEVVYNPDFFIDLLRVLQSGELVLELKDKTSPAVFKRGRDYIYLIMPMTIDI